MSETKASPSARQDISMQILRLEGVIDHIAKLVDNNLGGGHKISKEALKAFLYMQGLKCDWEALKKEEKVV